MQKGTDIFPPQVVNGSLALTVTIIFSTIIVSYFVVRKIMQLYVLRAQKRLAARQKPNAAQIISAALAEIEQVRAMITSHQLDPKGAAEKLSFITRNAFDQLMNHTTLSQTKYEVAQRNIKSILSLLEQSYPVEFSINNYDVTYALQLCDQSKAVVESCR